LQGLKSDAEGYEKKRFPYGDPCQYFKKIGRVQYSGEIWARKVVKNKRGVEKIKNEEKIPVTKGAAHFT